MRPRGREIELKLEVGDGAAEAIERLPMLTPEGTKRLHAVYYDTPDRALDRAGLSLRVRRNGESFVQTAKLARGGAALFDRVEREMPVAGEALDLSMLADPDLAIALPPGFDPAALRPAFTVEVERTVWLAALPEGRVELVLDRGTVHAGEASEPVSEAELELIIGSPDALFALAGAVADTTPVRLGVLTKSARGQRLGSGRIGRAVKAGPLELDPAMSIAEAFAAITGACLAHFRLNEPLALDGHADALHQARVALRRLRSALTLFRDVLADDPASPPLRDRLRALSGELGKARNLDVLLERTADGPARDALMPLRAEAYAAVRTALDVLQGRRLPLDLLAWAETGAWRGSEAAAGPIGPFAVQVLDRFRRRIKRRGRRLSHIDDEARHGVRIEAKKLRYATEFFAGLFDDEHARRRRKAFLGSLEALQEKLGALNDIATAREMETELAARGIAVPPVEAGDVRALIDAAAEARHALLDVKRFWR